MEQLDILSVLKDLAIIVVFAKVFGLIARKLKAPQVVGESSTSFWTSAPDWAWCC